MSKPKPKPKKDGQDEIDYDDLAEDLQAKVQVTQRMIVQEQEKSHKSRLAIKEMHDRMHSLNEELKAQELSLDDITSRMNRQYKLQQDELQNKIKELRKEVAEKDEALNAKDRELEDYTAEMDDQIHKKEEEIVELRRKIEDMSGEFARMLKETLDKMQERIELAQVESDNDPQLLKKLKDISNFIAQ